MRESKFVGLQSQCECASWDVTSSVLSMGRHGQPQLLLGVRFILLDLVETWEPHTAAAPVNVFMQLCCAYMPDL